MFVVYLSFLLFWWGRGRAGCDWLPPSPSAGGSLFAAAAALAAPQGRWWIFMAPQGWWWIFIAPQGRWRIFVAPQGRWRIFIAPQGRWWIFIAPQGRWWIFIAPQGRRRIFYSPAGTVMNIYSPAGTLMNIFFFLIYVFFCFEMCTQDVTTKTRNINTQFEMLILSS